MTHVIVVGGGPAGLMAAERLSAAGVAVTVHERMPSLGRKLLMAGRGGLNLTHSEPWDRFLARYGPAEARLRPLLDAFTAADLIAWAEGLGQETFVGASGRVFPRAMKASPLLRAWIGRLAAQGVRFEMRSRWTGFADDGALSFERDGETSSETADAVIVATGGASWPRLGSDGAALELLAAAGAPTRPFAPANAGVNIAWSPAFAERFAGEPLKACAFTVGSTRVRGEAVITRYGLEGGAVYVLGPVIRAALARDGAARLYVDLRPDMKAAEITPRIVSQPANQSASNRLRKAVKLGPAALALLREPAAPMAHDAIGQAERIKGVALNITGSQGLARAISSSGGVLLEGLDTHLMLTARPGVFCAGELMDWEAPTGGYLLQAAFATGRAAADGALAWLGA